MQSTQKKAEAGDRRLHPRITPERVLIALSGDYFGLPYNLSDISMGGMAFLYLNDSPLPLTDSQIDLYLNEELQISQLPVQVVSDQKQNDYFKLQRRCSVRFGELTQEQSMQLQAFINSHTAINSHAATGASDS